MKHLCEHGTLERKCETCALRTDLGAINSENTRLREALTWAVRFIECQCPRTAGDYPDYHNAYALMMGHPITTGPFWHARTEVELLRAENDRLREALKPFAEYAAKVSDGWPDSTDVSTDNKPTVTLGDCRRAKEALEAKS